MDDSILTVIPTYNRAWSIVRAVESVLKQKNQSSYVLVVDDCSNDNTREVLKQYFKNPKFSYIGLKGNPTFSPSTGRNVGLLLNKFKYIDFLDSDDEYDLLKHERQLEKINMPIVFDEGLSNLTLVPNSGVVDYVLGRTQIVYKDREITKGHVAHCFATYYPNITKPNAEYATFTSIFSGLFRTSIFETLGGFKVQSAGEDTNLYDRLFAAGYNIYFLNETTYIYYKNHDESTIVKVTSAESKPQYKIDQAKVSQDKFDMLKARSISERSDLFVSEIDLDDIEIDFISNTSFLSYNENLPVTEVTKHKVQSILA